MKLAGEETENILAGRDYQSSFEVSHTTRGNTWTVKVRGDDDSKVLERMHKIYDELEEKYGEVKK